MSRAPSEKGGLRNPVGRERLETIRLRKYPGAHKIRINPSGVVKRRLCAAAFSFGSRGALMLRKRTAFTAFCFAACAGAERSGTRIYRAEAMRGGCIGWTSDSRV